VPKAQTAREARARMHPRGEIQTVPRAYAGQWVAWSSDGRRIVAVGVSFRSCEEAAARAGFPADQIAIDRVPVSRHRPTGSGM
jgi:hypothetical protein